MQNSRFPIWKEIVIGGKSRQELVEALKADRMPRFVFDCWSRSRRDFTVTAEPVTVRLVRTSVRELGFLRGAAAEDVLAHAHAFGLRLCPMQVGPYVRLADQNQPAGDHYEILLDAISAGGTTVPSYEISRCASGVFFYLNIRYVRMRGRVPPEERLVFLAPEEAAR